MSKTEVILPAMGEGIIEATITRWLVHVGDIVQEDEPLLEVATDKVDSEIPSPGSGVITRIIYHEGEIPKVGEVLAIIETKFEKNEMLSEESSAFSQEPKVMVDKTVIPEAINNAPEVIENKKIPKENKSDDDILITPYIRYFAKNRGISIDELRQIQGSGLGDRITKADLNLYITSGRTFISSGSEQIPITQKAKIEQEGNTNTDYILQDGEELIEMDRTRKLIADHMVRSKQISPHVTSTVEVDVSSLVNWRNKEKDKFYKLHGVKLTFTPLVVVAAVKALKDFPGINISVAGNYIVQKDYINIGVATALPDGNLIVPVIKGADKNNFVSISRQVADLAERARKNKLNPTEIRGGTFTITNMGRYDTITGTPIINQPEVAILAVGAIKKKPAVVLVNGIESIGIRDIMVLSLTYDHRVVDGSLGGSFVQRIGKYLSEEIPDY